jgi:hypothetical protein
VGWKVTERLLFDMAKSKWNTEKAKKIAKEVGLKALRIGGEAILTEAIDETPMEFGTLRRSGVVTVGSLPDSGQVYQAALANQPILFEESLGKDEVVFISFNTPYARIQHEALGYRHKHGKAKYLEDAFNRNKSKVRKYVNKAIKRALRGG